jgi:hypothetical protein
MVNSHVLAVNNQQYAVDDFDPHWLGNFVAGKMDSCLASISVEDIKNYPVMRREGWKLEVIEPQNSVDDVAGDEVADDPLSQDQPSGSDRAPDEDEIPTPSYNELSNTMKELLHMVGRNDMCRSFLHTELNMVKVRLTDFIRDQRPEQSNVGNLLDPTVAPQSIHEVGSWKRTKAFYEIKARRASKILKVGNAISYESIQDSQGKSKGRKRKQINEEGL